jgi:hypothetical protein
MKNFQGEQAVGVVDSLAADGFVQSLTRVDRLNVYTLFERLVDRFCPGKTARKRKMAFEIQNFRLNQFPNNQLISQSSGS